MEDIIEHGANGRLLRYNSHRRDQVLIKGMHFANGVAVGPNDDYVLVDETAGVPRAALVAARRQGGSSDVFIDNLPGFPDNITFNGKDRFWLALAAPRDPLLDKVADQPGLRKAIARLPAALQPSQAARSCVRSRSRRQGDRQSSVRRPRRLLAVTSVRESARGCTSARSPKIHGAPAAQSRHRRRARAARRLGERAGPYEVKADAAPN